MTMKHIPQGQNAADNIAMHTATLAHAFSNYGDVIDAATKLAFVGFVEWEDGLDHAIRKVGTKTGASLAQGTNPVGVRVSLQDISTTAGPPMQPDNVVDEYYITATMPSQLTWFMSGNLSADRNAPNGSPLAVVYDFSTFTSGSAFKAEGLSQTLANKQQHNCHATLSSNGGTTWSQTSPNVNVVFESADAVPVYGTLKGALPLSSITTLGAWNNTNDPREYGLKVVCDRKCIVGGAWLYINPAGAYEVALYRDTTEIAKCVIDDNWRYIAGVRQASVTFDGTDAARTFVPGDVYRIMVRPTSASNVTTYAFNVSVAGHMNCLPGGSAYTYSTRSAAGAFTDTSTRRPIMGPVFTATDDGASSGGGVPFIPNLGSSNGGLD